MTGPRDQAMQPAVRAAVMQTVTRREALKVLRSPFNRPWREAFAMLTGDDDSAPDAEKPTPKRTNDRLVGLSLRVLVMLNDAPDNGPLYIRLIVEATGKQSSEITPTVNRLVRKGWAVDEREEVNETNAGRTPRRYVRITPAGRVRLNKARLSDLRNEG